MEVVRDLFKRPSLFEPKKLRCEIYKGPYQRFMKQSYFDVKLKRDILSIQTFSVHFVLLYRERAENNIGKNFLQE